MQSINNLPTMVPGQNRTFIAQLPRAIQQYQEPRQVTPSQFRLRALLTQQLREAAGGQQNTQNFFDDDDHFYPEQGGQLDLSFEDQVFPNSANDGNNPTTFPDANTNSTLAEPFDEEEEDIVFETELGFDAVNMFGRLKRRSPLIQPDVIFLNQPRIQRKRFDFDSAEYFRDKHLALTSIKQQQHQSQDEQISKVIIKSDSHQYNEKFIIDTSLEAQQNEKLAQQQNNNRKTD